MLGARDLNTSSCGKRNPWGRCAHRGFPPVGPLTESDVLSAIHCAPAAGNPEQRSLSIGKGYQQIGVAGSGNQQLFENRPDTLQLTAFPSQTKAVITEHRRMADLHRARQGTPPRFSYDTSQGKRIKVSLMRSQ
ncbi:hypothetical protein AUR04nite_28390 [Glutamicibacter uratoxydans]|uniref:Uncharacterized protein n=1 Tax=Glutamicibacter uratoxydans TaxID=43667 RepID=A0A4Y4DRR3_GLUUR|nr:hypothetical protein AUR04nite_28390 [Glutamicibacter uratoxydans]